MFFVLKRDNRKRDEKYGTLEEIYTIIQQYGSKESINEKETEAPTTTNFSMTKNEFVDLPHVLLERWGLHGYSREDIANLGDKHPMFRYLC